MENVIVDEETLVNQLLDAINEIDNDTLAYAANCLLVGSWTYDQENDCFIQSK